jgi:hypothetical protein
MKLTCFEVYFRKMAGERTHPYLVRLRFAAHHRLSQEGINSPFATYSLRSKAIPLPGGVPEGRGGYTKNPPPVARRGKNVGCRPNQKRHPGAASYTGGASLHKRPSAPAHTATALPARGWRETCFTLYLKIMCAGSIKERSTKIAPCFGNKDAPKTDTCQAFFGVFLKEMAKKRRHKAQGSRAIRAVIPLLGGVPAGRGGLAVPRFGGSV